MAELEVHIALTDPLLATEAHLDAASEAVAQTLGALSEQLDLLAHVRVSAGRDVAKDGAFPATLTVGGAVLPIASDLLASALALHRGDWPVPDAAAAATALGSLEADELGAVLGLAAQELVIRHPPVLLGRPQVQELAEACGSEDPDRLLDVARRLLDMRLRLGDPARLGEALAETPGASADLAEALIAERRATHLTIELEAGLLREVSIAADDEYGRGLLASAGSLVFDELGVILPPLHLQPTAALPAAFGRLRIGELATPAVRLPRVSEFISRRPPPENAEVTYTRTPANSLAVAIRDERGATALLDHGEATWNSLEYLALTVLQAARRHGHALVDMRTVDEQLNGLAVNFPRLTQALRAVCPLPALTRVLRELVRSRLSIADLPAVAQAIVDRPEHPEAAARVRLAGTATSRLAWQSTVPAYIVGDTLGAELAVAGAEPWLTPGTPEMQGLMRAHALELARITGDYAPPCVLVADHVRAAAAAALSVSHRDTIVAGFGDVPAWINVSPVARLNRPQAPSPEPVQAATSEG